MQHCALPRERTSRLLSIGAHAQRFVGSGVIGRRPIPEEVDTICAAECLNQIASACHIAVSIRLLYRPRLDAAVAIALSLAGVT
jgi:hypothetical protein